MTSDAKSVDAGVRTVLAIAGSDCSGGAGIQADLKTFAAHGVYGMSVITAVTAQNTLGVYGIEPLSPEIVAGQMEAVLSDISPDAAKIGMLYTEGAARAVADKLKKYDVKNIVVDPVLASTSGSPLLEKNALGALTCDIFPLALLITPNIMEAEELAGMKIQDKEGARACAEKLSKKYNAAVLIKGGHARGGADDFLYYEDGSGAKERWLNGKRIKTNNTHGTGCTLSSAIACGLAAGLDIELAVLAAKEYLRGALEAGLDIGGGNGPLDHCWQMRGSGRPAL